MIRYIGKCLLIEEGKEKILVIGDLHIGLEESLRESGVFISAKLVEGMVKELEIIFEKTGRVEKVVLLGDLKHYFGKIVGEEWREVLKLFDFLKKKCKKIIVIKGNHDVLIESITKKRKIVAKKIYVFKNYCFVHGDKDYKEIWSKKIKYVIVGHGHPAVKLREGVKIEKYKCFLGGKYLGKNWVMLPSFSEYSAGSDPREGEVILAWELPLRKFDVKIVGENLEVLDFGLLGRLN